MIVEVKIPSPGESISTVEIVQWFVTDGQFVNADQELAEIESEKATLTVFSPASGQIKILAPTHKPIPVNSVACIIDTLKSTNIPLQQSKTNSKLDINNLKPESKIVEPPSSNTATIEPANIKITPLARKIMEEHQIQPEEVIQRINSQHVVQILKQKGSNPSFTPGSSDKPMEIRKPMSTIRKKISERLVAAKNQTAMLTTFNEIDMSALLQLKNSHQQQFQEKHGVKLGFMSFFTKATTLALQTFPDVNAMIDGDEIVYFNYTDIGIAVQTQKGLMVPVVRQTHLKTIPEIEKEIALLSDKARKGIITIDELKGGTFTISNGGVFGSLFSTPILNAPQTAILGMHTIQERPIALNGQVVIRPMMYVALSYDHRIIDGRDSVGFLKTIKNLIENPYKLLAKTSNADEELLGL